MKKKYAGYKTFIFENKGTKENILIIKIKPREYFNHFRKIFLENLN